MKVVRDMEGKRINLLEDRVTEPDGKGAFGKTFYAFYSSIRSAYKNLKSGRFRAGLVLVKEKNSGNVMDYYRDFGTSVFSNNYYIGCRAFSKETFINILKAAGIKNPKL